MATKRKGKRHPGVTIIKPDKTGRTGWRVRYVDADSGKTRKSKIPDAYIRTREDREAYAVRKSEQLADRRRELDAGAPRATGETLRAAIDRYYKAHSTDRASTTATKRLSTDKLITWCEANGCPSCDDLDRSALTRWRTSVVNEPKRKPAKKGKRGAKTEAGKRSPHSINRDLKKAAAVLRDLADGDSFAKLTFDDVRRALKPVRAPVDRKPYLKPAECKRLLAGALRHDSDTFETTRWVPGEGRPERTKYKQVAPFVAFGLLSGMRPGECLDLDWRHVDLDALDHHGNKCGVIEVTAASKTGLPRGVWLDVSPACRRLLAAQKLATGGKGNVWGLTEGEAAAARKRLVSEYGAPSKFDYQCLRRTCGTYLTCAPAIYGAASAAMSARQLGHSVEVAERHYVGVIRGIPRDVHDLENAMQITEEIERVIASIAEPKPTRELQIRN